MFEIAPYEDNVSLVTRTSYLGVTTISYDLTIGSSKHCQLNIVQLQITQNVNMRNLIHVPSYMCFAYIHSYTTKNTKIHN